MGFLTTIKERFTHKEEQRKKAFWALLLTVFIDLLGLGIIIPVIATLFFRPEGLFFGLFSSEYKNVFYGLFLASYPLAQFIGAPVMGDLSDRYGRKKILLLSIGGTFISYLITILGIYKGSFGLLVASRLFDGFTGGNISVAYSAIADISKPKDKPKNFGMVGMAFGLGFIIGPFIGGVLSDPSIYSGFNFATPFIFSSILAFINILLIIFNLPETLKKKGYAAINPLSGFKNIANAISMIKIRELLSIIFLMTFGFTFFTQFFQVYLIEKFNFTQSDIGFLFAYVGIWIAITQGTIVRIVAKRFESQKVLLISILLSSITFPILLLPKNPAILYLFIPLVAIFQGVTQPNLTSIISNLASSDTQGEIMGIQQSINSLGLAIPPIIAGFIINIDINLPILIAGIMIFIAWVVYLAFYYNQSKRRFEDHK